MTKFKNALAASAIACLMVGTGAHAQMRETVHARITYDDLNLSTAAGLAKLNHRIAWGIRQACGDPTANLSVAADVRQCVAEMRADSAQRVAALTTKNAAVQVAGLNR